MFGYEPPEYKITKRQRIVFTILAASFVLYLAYIPIKQIALRNIYLSSSTEVAFLPYDRVMENTGSFGERIIIRDYPVGQCDPQKGVPARYVFWINNNFWIVEDKSSQFPEDAIPNETDIIVYGEIKAVERLNFTVNDYSHNQYVPVVKALLVEVKEYD